MKNGGEWCENEIRANISLYAVYGSNSSIGEMKCAYLKCYFSVVVSFPAFTSESLTDSQQHVWMGTGKESSNF